MTNDHVPPRCLFPSPRPSDLITVPACAACNHTFALDDEYFLVFAVCQASLLPRWESFALAALNRRSSGLRRRLAAEARRVAITTPTGLYVGDGGEVFFEGVRINRVVERIIPMAGQVLTVVLPEILRRIGGSSGA